MPWRVLPDDKTPSFVQVWLEPLSRSETQRIEVALQPPKQETGTFSKLGKALEWTDGTVAYARLYHQRWKRPGDQQRECVTIAIRATDDDGEGKPVVPAGLWHIKIRGYGEVKQTLTVDLHVHRDDVSVVRAPQGAAVLFRRSLLPAARDGRKTMWRRIGFRRCLATLTSRRRAPSMRTATARVRFWSPAIAVPTAKRPPIRLAGQRPSSAKLMVFMATPWPGRIWRRSPRKDPMGIWLATCAPGE